MASTINASNSGSGGLISTGDATGALALQTAGTTAVTVDTSQNVGIGTSSPTDTGAYGKALDVQGSGGSAVYVRSTTTPSTNYGYIGFTGGAGNLDIWNNPAGNIRFYNNSSERMRIDSSGNLLLATTSQIFSGKLCIAVNLSTFNPLALQNTTTQSAGQSFMYMANSAGNKAGSIDHTGTTTVAYTTSSDYRMKENIAPMTGALNTVLQLKPCTYTWKEDGKSGQGFIAHELQSVVPDCVSGEKDAVDADGNPVYQGVDTSFLVATLTAALQETKALIDQQAETINALTARLVALEGK